MTNLKKIIDKAIEGGFKFPEGWMDYSLLNLRQKEIYVENIEIQELDFIIFSIPFLKAFFGEEDMWYKTECTCGGIDFHIGGHDAHKPDCAKPKADRGWKWHAQQLVLSEDRLKYLMGFVNG